MRIYSVIFPLIFAFLVDHVHGQSFNLGRPFTISHSKKSYEAGTQNWDIINDGRGVVYFANNEGMLQFDGQKWTTYPLPNSTIVRSLAYDKKSKIYVGGQNELGYFASNALGDWTYTSLVPLLKESDRNLEDVWDIVIHEESVYFRTSRKLYCYNKGRFQVFKPSMGGFFNFIGLAGKRLIVQDDKLGLGYINDSEITTLPNTTVFTHSPLKAILPLDKNEWLIVTMTTGFFKYDGKNLSRWRPRDNNFLVENEIFSAAILKDGQLAFGTALGGLLIVHPDGRTLYHLSKENGLLNNKIRSLQSDGKNNLWLGLDDGINYVLTGSPFTHFSPDGKAEGAGYTIEKQNGNFYFGTGNGVFSIPQKEYYNRSEKTDFRLIKNSKGQAWGLNKVGDDLFLGHHSGAYLITDKDAIKVCPDWGYWGFESLIKNPNQMLAGTYTGLALFNYEDGQWKYQHRLKGFSESSRFLAQDEFGNIWIAHPYKGIYRLNIDADLKKVTSKIYGEKNGLPSNLSNYVFVVNGEVIFCGKKGVYTYDNKKDRFVPYQRYNQIFGKQHGVRRLFEGANKDIWYVTERDAGLLKVQEKSILKEVERISFPELREHLLAGFEFVYPLDQHNVFIGTEKGFIHYNPSKSISKDSLFHVILNEVSTTNLGDSIIFHGLFSIDDAGSNLQTETMIPTFQSNISSIRFGYSATNYSHSEETEFQIYLEGLEDYWSDWTPKFEKEYTNLEAGTYTFHVKGRAINGDETKQLSYKFTILPPWYQTIYAYSLYLLVIAAIIGGSILFFIQKYTRQKEIVKVTVMEVESLKNKNLQSEVAFKNRELASATFHLLHKNELLSKIKSSLIKIEKGSRNSPIGKEIDKVVKMLETEENAESGWDQFIAHFNKVHPGFFDKLKTKYPDLSPKDLKMCAYLRMNLSTKEIASLFNITIRGVEGGRYRVRKKMGLDNNMNLTNFIMKL